jgi:hypothetical protein
MLRRRVFGDTGDSFGQLWNDQHFQDSWSRAFGMGIGGTRRKSGRDFGFGDFWLWIYGRYYNVDYPLLA